MTQNHPVLIICGESSADYYGAQLATTLSRHSTQAIFSVGGPQLAQHSTQLLAIDTSAHCVGVHDSKRLALNSIKSSLKRRLPSLIQDHGIQTVIIIDFPNYNFFIANIIQPFNCRIITFITPNFWIWNHTRLGQQLAQYSDDIITIFNQEHAFYSQLAPSKTHYFGHPLTIDYQPPAPFCTNHWYISRFTRI